MMPGVEEEAVLAPCGCPAALALANDMTRPPALEVRQPSLRATGWWNGYRLSRRHHSGAPSVSIPQCFDWPGAASAGMASATPVLYSFGDLLANVMLSAAEHQCCLAPPLSALPHALAKAVRRPFCVENVPVSCLSKPESCLIPAGYGRARPENCRLRLRIY